MPNSSCYIIYLHNFKASIAPLLGEYRKLNVIHSALYLRLYWTDILSVHENDTFLPSDLLKENLLNRNHFPTYLKAVMLIQRQKIIHTYT